MALVVTLSFTNCSNRALQAGRSSLGQQTDEWKDLRDGRGFAWGLEWLFMWGVEEGSFKGERWAWGKAWRKGQSALWRIAMGAKMIKKNSTPLSMLPSFLPSQRTRIGDEEIIDWKGTACKVEIKKKLGKKQKNGTEKTRRGKNKSFPEAEPRLCEEGLDWVAASIQRPRLWQNDWQTDRGCATSSQGELWPPISHTSYYSLSIVHCEGLSPICQGNILKKNKKHPCWLDMNQENPRCGLDIPNISPCLNTNKCTKGVSN